LVAFTVGRVRTAACRGGRRERTEPGALLLLASVHRATTNPTGTAANRRLVAALIANGTYIPATPKSVQASYDLSAVSDAAAAPGPGLAGRDFETDLQPSGS